MKIPTCNLFICKWYNVLQEFIAWGKINQIKGFDVKKKS